MKYLLRVPSGTPEFNKMLIVANIFGWVVAHWRHIAVGAGILAVVIGGILVFRSCSARKVKLDEKQILEAQKAIAENDRKAMEKVLIESDANEAEITATATNATAAKVNAIQESKKKVEGMSNDELAAELERRAQ